MTTGEFFLFDIWAETADLEVYNSFAYLLLGVAQHAVTALGCAFLVVDLAQTVDGEWIIIECNDGMESGYAGASPLAIWQAIIEHESKR